MLPQLKQALSPVEFQTAIENAKNLDLDIEIAKLL
jgi:hypothetical protein